VGDKTMEKRCFSCDPKKYGCNAGCCSGNKSIPELMVADFLRISENAGIPIHEIWDQHGFISLFTMDNMPQFHFKLGTGLFHEPCPYLNLENRCGIYDARPIACFDFPLNIFLDHGDLKIAASRYKCLSGEIVLSENQQHTRRELEKLYKKGAQLDIKYFWNNGLGYVDLSDIGSYPSRWEKATQIQLRRDPNGESPRTQRLLGTIKKYQKFMSEIKSRSMFQKQVYIDGNEYASLWSPVLFSFFGGAISRQFQNLPAQAMSEYREFNQRYKEAVSKLTL
jgi:Fe-S-cluster containining protein